MKKTNVPGALALALLAAACGKLDVVGSGSERAFAAMLEALPEPAAFDAEDGGWVITAPDGEARFIWSRDDAESPRYDIALKWDAAPFLAAGLDPALLPEPYAFDGAAITLGRKLGGERASPGGEETPLASYRHIVTRHRAVIGYHAALDHYGVDVGNGALFEFAKDMAANDKDIVFALAPAPFIAAGLDPRNVGGWLFAGVTVDDANGRPVQVDKLLKPFDLR